MAQRSGTIAYFVHGHGRGHASRALSVVPALRALGIEVALFASGDALPMLDTLGEVAELPLLRPGKGIFQQLYTRARRERSRLAKLAPTLLISDGEQAALLAAKQLRIPSVAIGHDLVFSRCVLPPGLSRRHLLHQRLNALIPARLSTRRIAVHFLPISSSDPNTQVARVEGEPSYRDGTRIEQLVPYFRDPNGTRALTLAARAKVPLAPIAERLARPQFRALLQSAVGAIGSAGSNLIAECVLFQTPLLALYAAGDAEQALNAQLLAAADVGMACSFEALDEATIARFWARARARSFRSVALADALPSVVDAVLQTVLDLLGHDGQGGR